MCGMSEIRCRRGEPEGERKKAGRHPSDDSDHPMRSVRRLAALPKVRISMLLFTGLAVLLGLAGALARAGVVSILPNVVGPDDHGVLMVFGFLGTAISLERAVAYRSGGNKGPHWCFCAPLFGGLATVLLPATGLVSSMVGSKQVADLGHLLAGSLWIASMAVLLAIYVALCLRQSSEEVLMQMLAASVGLVGVALWTGHVDAVVLAPMWLMFLVLTIVGERVELARTVFSKPHVEGIVLALCLAVVVASAVQCLRPALGYPFLGLVLAVLLAYMLQHDVALGTWHNSGLTGFMGTCMVSAYAWGLLAAAVWMFAPVQEGGYWTDMGLHALALGFIMTMVIAHADVIIPSVVRRPMPFHPVLWAPWILVQGGLLLRLSGTVRGAQALWKFGDTVSVIGVLSMLLSDMGLVVFGRRILQAKRLRRAAEPQWSHAPRHRMGHLNRTDTKPELMAQDNRAARKDSSRVRSLRFMAVGTVFVILVLFVFGGYGLSKSSLSGNGTLSAADRTAGDAGHPSSDGGDLSAGIAATGRTTTVQISVRGMSFVPSSIRLPAGNRLVVVFANTGDQRHNLTFPNGKQTGNVPVGAKVTLDVGVVGRDAVAWCALAGHRQMGMELGVHAVGGRPAARESGSSEDTARSEGLSSDHSDLSSVAALQDYARSSRPLNASVPQDEFAGVPGVHERRYTFDITERKERLARGLTRTVWGYDEQSHPRDRTTEPLSPGPVLRGRVGDTFHVHLVNHGSMSHSIDFHAGPAVPQEMMRNIEPGKSLDYTFTADHAGIWLYHCSSDPMSIHIANGMYGAVLIEPDDLPAVDAEYLLIGSEMYLGGNGATADATKVSGMKPDIAAFDGRAFQYDSHPLALKRGGRVRLWILDAGPNMPLSFHVVGTQFDTVWSEGRYLLSRSDATVADGQERNAAAQVLPLQPAQGGFVELRIDKPGKYPFVNHVMSLAEKGEHGLIDVR